MPAVLNAADCILSERCMEQDRALAQAGKEPHFLDDLRMELGAGRPVAEPDDDDTPNVANVIQIAAWMDRANSLMGGG